MVDRPVVLVDNDGDDVDGKLAYAARGRCHTGMGIST